MRRNAKLNFSHKNNLIEMHNYRRVFAFLSIIVLLTLSFQLLGIDRRITGLADTEFKITDESKAQCGSRNTYLQNNFVPLAGDLSKLDKTDYNAVVTTIANGETAKGEVKSKIEKTNLELLSTIIEALKKPIDLINKITSSGDNSQPMKTQEAIRILTNLNMDVKKLDTNVQKLKDGWIENVVGARLTAEKECINKAKCNSKGLNKDYDITCYTLCKSLAEDSLRLFKPYWKILKIHGILLKTWTDYKSKEHIAEHADYWTSQYQAETQKNSPDPNRLEKTKTQMNCWKEIRNTVDNAITIHTDVIESLKIEIDKASADLKSDEKKIVDQNCKDRK